MAGCMIELDTPFFVIVDERPSEQWGFDHLAGTDRWAGMLQFADGARAALRRIGTTQTHCDEYATTPCVWLISAELTGISGVDLVQMLRPRLAGAVVVMFGDGSDERQEILARSCGVSMFLTRELARQWIGTQMRQVAAPLPPATEQAASAQVPPYSPSSLTAA